ncbi:MAG: GNAT family N-acetyltransferase [Burkholderiales bacterium]|nr:GNAT family N-acetyltransferase [Burkholderiales bacterium]
MPTFSVRMADWERDREALRAVREAVFVVEQGVPIELEWDEFDAVSTHVMAEDASGRAIGTGRLLPDGHIGRMAVLAPWRGHGIGAALLARLIERARDAGMDELRLHAQSHAVPFYARHGFACAGDEFIEAGIPHRLMCRRA